MISSLHSSVRDVRGVRVGTYGTSHTTGTTRTGDTRGTGTTWDYFLFRSEMSLSIASLTIALILPTPPCLRSSEASSFKESY